jgi:hypothetical protein
MQYQGKFLGFLEYALAACLCTTVLSGCAVQDPCAAEKARVNGGESLESISAQCAATPLGPTFQAGADRDQLCKEAIKTRAEACLLTITSSQACNKDAIVDLMAGMGLKGVVKSDCRRVFDSSQPCIEVEPCFASNVTSDPNHKQYYTHLCYDTIRQVDPACKAAQARVDEAVTQSQETEKDERGN